MASGAPLETVEILERVARALGEVALPGPQLRFAWRRFAARWRFQPLLQGQEIIRGPAFRAAAEFGGITQLKLLFNILAVRLDRLNAQVELLGISRVLNDAPINWNTWSSRSESRSMPARDASGLATSERRTAAAPTC